MHPSDTQLDPRELWNGRYGASEQVRSGNVNPTFAQIVADLTPGRALDLGSGGSCFDLSRNCRSGEIVEREDILAPGRACRHWRKSKVKLKLEHTSTMVRPL